MRCVRYIISIFCLTGCTVGPTYQATSQVDSLSQRQWHSPLPHNGEIANLETWWRQFDDPVLTGLIDQAEQHSPTLDAALARVRQARASAAGANAGLYPTLTLSGSSSRSKTESSGITSRKTTNQATIDAGWEIDLFGRKRSAIKQSRAQLASAESSWNDARVTLAAEVALAYVDERACQASLLIQSERMESQRTTWNLARIKLTAGLDAETDSDLAEAAYQASINQLEAQKGQCRQKQNLLSLLTAQPITDVAPLLETASPTVPLPREVSIQSVPANIVTQRPDVAAAASNLAAAGAAIGVAAANQYPSLSLNGIISLTKTLGTAAITTWSFGPALSLPLFQGGALAAEVERSEAVYEEARANYRSTVLTAVREVEDALTRLDTIGRRMEAAERSAIKYKDYLVTQEISYKVGNASLIELEQARRSAYAAEDTLTAARLERAQAWVSLYKSLGGGWHADTTTTR